ncbi:TPA: DNA-binding domain-containing protein [Citrobacter freundii]|nr:DNA-binding domain-containing protein [Citrobacter freundii]
MKTTLHAKLKWLSREKIAPQLPASFPVNQAELQPDWFIPQSAETLLATPLRQQLIKIIWQRTSLSGVLFAELYQAPVARFAELVQQLPASEYHHHSHPGGLLDHTLEVMAFAAKLRQRHLLPEGGVPEDQVREAEAWTAGIIYAALLHDVGKIATDIDVSTTDNPHWFPWQGALRKPYRLKYHKKRDHQFHPVAGSLLVMQILPVTALNWLAQYRELYEKFMYCISGHYDRAGVIGELVQEADRASVAQFMGANASIALERQQPSLAKQMRTALKELVQTQCKLSNPHSGSDGWLTEEALWLISKTTADRIRAWLLQQGVSSVPDSNVRLFDEMQAHGLIIPTPDGKAVWSCNITADSGWTPGCSLTLLRLSPSRLWNTREDQPMLFAGTVIPVTNSAEYTANADSAQSAALSAFTGTETALTELAFSLFAPQASEDGETIDQPADNITEQAGDISLTPLDLTTKQPSYNSATDNIPVNISGVLPGTDFLAWLKEGIRSRKITVNNVLARVHMVDRKVFLVSPEIFKLYVKTTTGSVGDEWKQVQKTFQKLKLHQRGSDGINIFTCEVKGPRKTRRVKGYLLDNPGLIFGDNLPEDNPYLSVVIL